MEYINAFCIAWTIGTIAPLLWAAIDALRHRRPRRRTPPNGPRPPLQPFTGKVLPYVNPRPQAFRESANARWLREWRDQNPIVANPHIGDEYRSLNRLDERRLTRVK